jgi:undecaprenyl-diphosphatase
VARLLLPLGLLAAFAILGLLVREGPPEGIDRAAAAWARSEAPPGSSAVLEAWSRPVDGAWRFVSAGLLVLLVAVVAGRRQGLVVLACSLALMGLVHGAKEVFGRTRPVLEGAGEDGASRHSYPSGHVAFAAGVVGATAAGLTVGRRRRWRAAAWAVVAFAVLGMAASRIHLGRHHLTDTVGGALLGLAVVLLAAPWRQAGLSHTTSPPGVK